MKTNLTHEPKSGFHLLTDRSVVLHCNHYNIELQNTILLPEYINGYEIQFISAAEISYNILKETCEKETINSRSGQLTVASHIYQKMGLGLLDFSGITEHGGVLQSNSSHYHLGWQNRFGKIEKNAHVLTAGYIAGVLTFVYNHSYMVEPEYRSSKLIFNIQKKGQAKYTENLNKEWPVFPTTQPEFPEYSNPLPCQDITKEVLQALPQSNESGLIEAFGVLLTYLPSEYYGLISYRFEEALDRIGGIEGLAKPLLVESGHICGFNTFGGIMTSEVWNTLILPMLSSKEDWVFGMVSVINALGWGHWHVQELVDNKKLVLRVYNSTEAIAYRKHFGTANKAKCYTAEGAAAAIMNLIYKGDIMEAPDLTKEYYNSVFRHESAFSSKETKCVAKGDDYCEFEFRND